MPQPEAHKGSGEDVPVVAGGQSMPTTPQQPQADRCHHIHQQVKQAVGEDQHPYVMSGLFNPAQQVMPLQNLMEQNTIEKPAKGEPQQITAPAEIPRAIT